MTKIGITERGDAALDLGWFPWVQAGNPAILITKDPAALKYILLDHKLFQELPENVIVHCTITGWGSSRMEPNVDPYDAQIECGFKDLYNILGGNRVVLRIDPIIPTVGGNQFAEEVMKCAIYSLGHNNFRTRISFIDLYPHAKARIEAAGYKLPWQSFHAPLERRRAVYATLSQLNPNIEVCSEPDFECAGCVSKKDLDVFGLQASNQLKGQRKECKCLALKHELLNRRGQCKHCCAYCYWK